MSNQSGSAFPSHGSMGEVTQEGMTLRQYAAIKLMAAIWAGCGGPVQLELDAQYAVIAADALLAELEKTP